MLDTLCVTLDTLYNVPCVLLYSTVYVTPYVLYVLYMSYLIRYSSYLVYSRYLIFSILYVTPGALHVTLNTL